MKTRVISLIAIIIIASTTQSLVGQKSIKVEAVNDDISYYLDLKAVASIFGDARNLEEFENQINDYDAQISNLDLNSDGQVDYLRVIETSENNTHLVVIQAVLERDVFQDVATIVVERDRYKRTYVQVVGDPYIYGANYIINPMYHHTPTIYSWFWTSSYRPWYSPYYYGYYPRVYRYRNPVSINIYLSHINVHINHHHRYAYNNEWRNPHAYKIYTNVCRNDYGNRYPDRTYSRRNVNVSNRYEMDKTRNTDYVTRNSGSGTRQNSSASQSNRAESQRSQSSRMSNRESSREVGSETRSDVSRDINRGSSRQSSSDSGRESVSTSRPTTSSSTSTRESRPEVRKTDRAPETISREVKSTRQQTTQPSSSTSERKSVSTAPSSSQRSSASSTTRSSSSSRSSRGSSSDKNEGGRR